MKPIVDHHHYRLDQLDFDGFSDRVAIYERYVIDMLLQSDLDDSQRESSIAFELMHHHSTVQLARILARTRDLPLDVCSVGALLHDVYVMKCGKYKEHAHKSAELASMIIDEIGGFSSEEKEQILTIIYNHSDKEIWSDNPLTEFGKDVDTLDCFLYPNAFGYYLKHKKLPVFYNYVLRAKKVWDELSIPQPRDFMILDNYNEHWLNQRIELTPSEANTFVGLVCHLSSTEDSNIVPPTLIFKEADNGNMVVYANSDNYRTFEKDIENLSIVINSEEAERLVALARQAYLLVWPAINAYEELTEANNSRRLAELGLAI